MQFSRKSTVWIFDKKPPQRNATRIFPRHHRGTAKYERSWRIVLWSLGSRFDVGPLLWRLVQRRIKLGSFKGKFTGKPYIWWGKSWFPEDFPWSQSIDRQKQHCRVLKNKSCEIFSVRRETMKGKNTIRYLLLAASDSLGCSSRLPQFFQFGPDPLRRYWKNQTKWLVGPSLFGWQWSKSIHFSIQSSWNDPSWSHQGLRSNTWCTWGTPRKPGTCWCVARRASSTMRLIKSGWGCLNLSGSGVIKLFVHIVCYCHH